jgi:hypothetical protein
VAGRSRDLLESDTSQNRALGGMITNRDSGVADGPHAAVVHHRLDDDPGSLGEAARASWRGTLFTWVHGLSLLCNIWSSARAGDC